MIKKTNDLLIIKTYFKELNYFEYKVYRTYLLFNKIKFKRKIDHFSSLLMWKYNLLVMNPNNNIKEQFKNK